MKVVVVYTHPHAGSLVCLHAVDTCPPAKRTRFLERIQARFGRVR